MSACARHRPRTRSVHRLVVGGAVVVCCLAGAVRAQPTPGARAEAPKATSVLRVSCDGSNANAEVSVNGVFKGECPIDIPVAAGSVELRAVKKISETHERIFERTLRLGEGVAKREEVELGEPQLTADARRQDSERRQQQQAEAAARALAQERLRAQALEEERRAHAALRQRAEAGDLPSLLQWAELLDQRPGPQARPEESFGWWLRAAQLAHVPAMFRVARRLENGYGVAQDRAAALGWYRQAAEAGHAGAMGGLAGLHFHGGPGAPDPALARAWADKAMASGGDARAMEVLSLCAQLGLGGLAQNSAVAEQWMARAAAAGSRRAQGLLAMWRFQRGSVDGQAEADLIARMAQASAAGPPSEDGVPADAAVLARLGVIHFLGSASRPPDPALALHWYRRAAEAGSAAGMVSVAEFHLKGLGGLPASEADALPWYRRAAEAGSALAMYQLGLYYGRGLAGLAVDKAVAADWFRKALAAGHPGARAGLEALGHMR